jgi:hypothetical protein
MPSNMHNSDFEETYEFLETDRRDEDGNWPKIQGDKVLVSDPSLNGLFENNHTIYSETQMPVVQGERKILLLQNFVSVSVVLHVPGEGSLLQADKEADREKKGISQEPPWIYDDNIFASQPASKEETAI